ncbi:MAG: LysM peptidoglycan-binding domain-containing protein [Limnochordia bacterium]|jgi:murein DD-endopeptidase MepM/ murein hydrolase activator NlpD
MHRWKRRLATFITAIIFLTFVVALASASTNLLREGDRGQRVKELQQALVRAGFEVTIDGIFGSETSAVLRQFQQQQGLTADGIAGPATFQALEAVINPPRIIHRVQAGDSLYVLARRYNTTVEEIQRANNLASTTIVIGQKLEIPQAAGAGPAGEIAYTVAPGDNLSVIAKRFNTTVAEIRRVNGLENPHLLQVGQQLRIRPQTKSQGLSMIWPVRGRITSRYGPRIHPVYGHQHFHGGIDIAVPQGTPIRAAAGGTVAQTGRMGAAGLVVVIDHGGGVTSWYLHNSRINVRKGQQVRQGEVIALSGSTGVVTGPHLDFRIKINDRTTDPLTWLP